MLFCLKKFSVLLGIVFYVHSGFAALTCVDVLTSKNKSSKPQQFYPEVSDEESAILDRVVAMRESLQESILERDYLIDLGFLALIAKEHMLMVGSPGNAKSMLARAFFESILFQSEDGFTTSFWSLMMSPETTLQDTHGPFDFKLLEEKSVYKRNLDNGMLRSAYNFLDEFLDAPIRTLRSGVLQTLNERTYSEGGETIEGKLWTAFAATNYSLPEAYAMAEKMNMPPNTLKAILDRFAFIAFVPKGTAKAETDRQLFKGEFRKTQSPIFHTDVEFLNSKMKEVVIPDHIAEAYSTLKVRFETEIDQREVQAMEDYSREVMSGSASGVVPFKGVKFMSNRTTTKAGRVLTALVVFDWILKKGQRSLEANFEDLAKLNVFMGVNGPDQSQLDVFTKHAIKKDEIQQIEALSTERDVFEKHINGIYDEVTREVQRVLQSFLEHEDTQLAKRDLEQAKGLDASYIAQMSKKRKKKLTAFIQETSKWLGPESEFTTEDRSAKVALMYLSHLLETSK